MNVRSGSRINSFLTRRIAAYDEAQAQADEVGKDAGPFRLGSLFEDPAGAPGEPGQEEATRVRKAAEQVFGDADSFYMAGSRRAVVEVSGVEGKFLSLVSDGTANDVARFSYFPARGAAGKPAIVILHHWNAESRNYNIFGRLFSRLGLSAVVMTLPHHGARGNGSAVANRFLNADASNSVRSVMQAVLDVQIIVDWLKASEARQVGVLGVSLGSCVAALAAAFNPDIRSAALLLTAGDYASVVWSGRATRHIRKAMDGHISLQNLRLLWRVISPSSFVDRFAASSLKMLILSGMYDQIVLPDLACEFVEQLKRTQVSVRHLRWHCGHYSLGLPPFSVLGLVYSFAFLKTTLKTTASAAKHEKTSAGQLARGNCSPG
jgi:pimeloyl-ACP methyl ester carboxylesterase